MATRITEGRLAFDFDDDWTALKYDDSGCYRNGIERLKGTLVDRRGSVEKSSTKALDVAACKNGTLLFIEIKDFRGHRIENKYRVGDNLALEVALKVRDSIAGIAGCFCTGRNNEVAAIRKTLGGSATDVHVILWLEEDSRFPSATACNRHKGRQSALSKKLKQRCAWLTTKALVASLRNPIAVQGFTVGNLPGAGQPHVA